MPYKLCTAFYLKFISRLNVKDMMLKFCLVIHISCAFLSMLLLIVRGSWQIKAKDWRSNKLLLTLPHFSDSLLILSGVGLWILTDIGLVWWLLLKIGLLIEYILFSAKFFSQKSNHKNNNTYLLAIICLSCAVLLGYYH